MNVTASMLASIPLWVLTAIFVGYVFFPKPEYRSKKEYPKHLVMCVLFGSITATLAKVIWDGAFTVGYLVSIPFWTLAIFSIIGTWGCIKDRKPEETEVDLVVQGFIGIVLVGIFGALAAACVKFL